MHESLLFQGNFLNNEGVQLLNMYLKLLTYINSA